MRLNCVADLNAETYQITTMDERDYKAMNKYENGNEVLADVSCWVDIELTNKFPPENETVWLYNNIEKYVTLGCNVWVENEGWYWAVTNGIIYAENGKIITECEMDDYNFTHWHSVPKLPCS